VDGEGEECEEEEGEEDDASAHRWHRCGCSDLSSRLALDFAPEIRGLVVCWRNLCCSGTFYAIFVQ
jgi:hypothetical protein